MPTHANNTISGMQLHAPYTRTLPCWTRQLAAQTIGLNPECGTAPIHGIIGDWDQLLIARAYRLDSHKHVLGTVDEARVHSTSGSCTNASSTDSNVPL